MAPTRHDPRRRPRPAHLLPVLALVVAACSSPRRVPLDLGPDPYAVAPATGALADPTRLTLATPPRDPVTATPPTGLDGLDSLVGLALARSPELAAARAGVEARTAAIGAAGSLPEPRVTWTELLEPVETRVGPQERRLMVTQPLPWSGAREAERDGARAAARVAAAELADAERALAAEVEAAAWRRDLALELATLEDRGVELLRVILADVDAAYRTGRAEYADLLRAGDEVALAEERAATARDAADRETARLEAVVGARLGGGLDALVLEHAPADLTARLAARAADLVHPALEALDHRVAEARAAERGLAFARKSDLALGLLLVDVAPRTEPDAPPDNGEDALGVSLSFTLPIRGDRYDADERAARWELRAARARRAAAEEDLVADLALAREDLAAAERRLTLYAGRLVQSAAETLETQRAAYASGRASFTDVTLAARRQLELEAELARARADRELARIAIERHLGPATEPQP